MRNKLNKERYFCVHIHNIRGEYKVLYTFKFRPAAVFNKMLVKDIHLFGAHNRFFCFVSRRSFT